MPTNIFCSQVRHLSACSDGSVPQPPRSMAESSSTAMVGGQLDHICHAPATASLALLGQTSPEVGDTARRLLRDRYVFCPGAIGEVDPASTDWSRFADSWASLATDDFMADGGTYRRRRYQVLRASGGIEPVEVLPSMPLYQAPSYNSLNGGCLRQYPAVTQEVLESESFRRALGHSLAAFTEVEHLSGQATCRWFIEVDQFRIRASAGQAGLPTPEGIHHDGGDGIVMMLVGRQGVTGGETTLYDLHRNPIRRQTLTRPGEAFLVNDRALLHGVSPIEVLPNLVDGTRDLMVMAMTNLARPGSIVRRFGEEAAGIDLSLGMDVPTAA